MQVTKRIDFCFGHRLPNYTGKCRNIHGHGGIVEVSFTTKFPDARNEFGMIVDFYAIKEIAKEWIDENWDHGFVANYKDTTVINFLKEQGLKYFVVTAEAMGVGSEDPLQLTNPTMENLTLLLQNVLTQRVDEFNRSNPKHPPIALAGIRMYESENNWCEATVTSNVRQVVACS